MKELIEQEKLDLRKRVGWTTEELAKEAGVNASRIRQLLGDGTIKGFKRGFRQWLIPNDEAVKWLESYRLEKGE